MNTVTIAESFEALSSTTHISFVKPSLNMEVYAYKRANNKYDIRGYRLTSTSPNSGSKAVSKDDLINELGLIPVSAPNPHYELVTISEESFNDLIFKHTMEDTLFGLNPEIHEMFKKKYMNLQTNTMTPEDYAKIKAKIIKDFKDVISANNKKSRLPKKLTMTEHTLSTSPISDLIIKYKSNKVMRISPAYHAENTFSAAIAIMELPMGASECEDMITLLSAIKSDLTSLGYSFI